MTPPKFLKPFRGITKVNSELLTHMKTHKCKKRGKEKDLS